MFNHKAKKAESDYETALKNWQARCDQARENLRIAKTFQGINSTEIVLKPGEKLFLKTENVGLVEPRTTGGHYEGGSSGLSIPIGSLGGRSIRYRAGASKGHYVQGTPTPTYIDVGTSFITNRRVVFVGKSQTRECEYDKMLSCQNDPSRREMTISIKNRQKPTTIFYGNVFPDAIFRQALAQAYYDKASVPAIVEAVEKGLANVIASKPVKPTEA